MTFLDFFSYVKNKDVIFIENWNETLSKSLFSLRILLIVVAQVNLVRFVFSSILSERFGTLIKTKWRVVEKKPISKIEVRQRQEILANRNILLFKGVKHMKCTKY